MAFLCYTLLGYRVSAFIIYLFFFALLCLSAGWGEAIAMDSVSDLAFSLRAGFGAKMLINECCCLS